MAINIARLGVVLGIDTAEFSKGIDSAKKKLGDISAMAGKASAIATAAFTAMTYKALQFADDMADLSDATGVSISKIVQMSQALQQSGGRAEDAGKVLIKFAQSVDQAREGSQQMQDAFAKAGVTLKDLATLPLDKLLDKTTNGLSNLGDKASQTGTKLDIFGKGLRTVDMQGFNSRMQEGTEQFDEYANSIRIAADLNDKLAKKTADFGLIFTQKVIPPVNLFFETINTKGGLAETVFDAVGNAIYNLIGYIEIARGSLQLLEVQWKSFKSIFTGGFSIEELNREAMNIDNNVKLALEKIRQYREEVAQTKKIETPQGQNVPVKSSPEVKKFEEMKRVAEELSEEYKRQQNYSLQQLAIRDLMVGMTEDERRIQEAINQVTNETSRKIDDITKKREDAVARAPAGRGDEIRAVYDAQIAEILRLEDVYIQAAKTNQKYSIETQRTFTFGWDKAFNQYRENAFNYARTAEEMFRSLTDNMVSALDRFVETGKFRFSDFASSVIKDLLKIQLRMQMMQMFSSIGGFGGIMNAIFRPSIEAQPGFVGPPVALAGSATGGFVDEPRIVGENGPEIFIPQRSGTVIPNQQLSSALQSQPQVVYNGPYIQNMSAIDTQSAVQFLSRNKDAVWSANQSASRSLPASRS